MLNFHKAMECNKEEAIRAKYIAEKKMQSRDFVGARKMMLKAQKLFPDLEHTLQMLTVCEVHCFAEAKVSGSEDWYGILQVEPTADDSLIKKQYKKLAFLLHPDKNKFAGAEAAFKLVGEAHRTLTDQTKRSVYDFKRSASIKTVGPRPQPNYQRTSGSRKQPAVPKSYTNHAATPFANLNRTSSTQQQTQATHASQTFWTICPSCGIRYQYYRSIVNKCLRCQNCLKPFVACEISAQDVPMGVNTGCPLNQSGIHQQKNSEAQKSASPQKDGGSGSSHTDAQKNEGGRPTVSKPVTRASVQGCRKKMEDSIGSGNESDRENEVKVEKVKLEKVNKRGPTVHSSGNANKKRRKVVVESSRTDNSDGEIVFEETGNAGASNTDTTGSHYPRRSARLKQNVAYNEDHSDADEYEISNSSEELRGSSHSEIKQSGKTSIKHDAKEPSVAAGTSKRRSEGMKRSVSTEEDMLSGNKEGKECLKKSGDLKGKDMSQEIAEDGAGLNPDATSSESNFDRVPYPDPEFHDFDKYKCSCFTVGQIWALYDNIDAMPRFYARIKTVSSTGFKVQFTWLEFNPVSQADGDWYNEELPVGCGSFMLGKTEDSDDIRMFSHLMPWTKGPKRNLYVIYPRKGEVWALFRGWDIKWALNTDQHWEYEYDVVEILSDFSVDTGVDVVSLVKVKGFVSLFCQGVGNGACTVHMPPSEFLRFSHLVPSYRMTGRERKGIPEGIYELDCASLPINLEEMFPCVTLDEVRGNFNNAGHENGTPASVSGVGERKSADEFRDHYTSGNNVERNVKSQEEKTLKGSDLPHKELSGACERKNVEGSGSEIAAAHAEKVVHERRPPEPVSEKEKDLNAPDAITNNATENQNDALPDSSSFMSVAYPNTEFYNFDLNRTKGRFETGQIWALYCEDDGFPKYYALVRKVDSGDFRVHITWLNACPLLLEEVNWSKSGLPFGCGRFRVGSGREAKETYDTDETFSHLVQTVYDEKKLQYDIYPQVKEVWALYMNWKVEWKLVDLKICLEKGEYDMVEVIYRSDSVITVVVLEKVDGFRAVFRPKRNNGTLAAMKIYRNEFLKFSHRVPAFRLTEERGGKLRGCWELDPCSVPDILFCTKTN